MKETIDRVLTFWFGGAQSAAEVVADKKRVWFEKNPAVDEEIETRFLEVVNAVASGELDHWRESAKGLLASIICTDQFSRNIFRGTAKSFSFDPIALGLAQQAVAMGTHLELSPIQRVFVYLPYEHSEDMAVQEQSLVLFKSLQEAVADDEKALFAGYLDFAQRHYDIVARFGRYPHRNAILGRESSDEEIEFLAQPGSSF